MLIKKYDGTFYDTHESFNDEREAEIQEIGDEIIEEFEDYYVDNCHVVKEYDDYRAWALVEDSPDYDESLQETIQDYITDKMTDDFITDLKEYVFDNVASESTLCERAVERYYDRLDDGPDYD